MPPPHAVLPCKVERLPDRQTRISIRLAYPAVGNSIPISTLEAQYSCRIAQTFLPGIGPVMQVTGPRAEDCELAQRSIENIIQRQASASTSSTWARVPPPKPAPKAVHTVVQGSASTGAVRDTLPHKIEHLSDGRFRITMRICTNENFNPGMFGSLLNKVDSSCIPIDRLEAQYNVSISTMTKRSADDDLDVANDHRLKGAGPIIRITGHDSDDCQAVQRNIEVITSKLVRKMMEGGVAAPREETVSKFKPKPAYVKAPSPPNPNTLNLNHLHIEEPTRQCRICQIFRQQKKYRKWRWATNVSLYMTCNECVREYECPFVEEEEGLAEANREITRRWVNLAVEMHAQSELELADAAMAAGAIEAQEARMYHEMHGGREEGKEERGVSPLFAQAPVAAPPAASAHEKEGRSEAEEDQGEWSQVKSSRWKEVAAKPPKSIVTGEDRRVLQLPFKMEDHGGSSRCLYLSVTPPNITPAQMFLIQGPLFNYTSKHFISLGDLSRKHRCFVEKLKNRVVAETTPHNFGPHGGPVVRISGTLEACAAVKREIEIRVDKVVYLVVKEGAAGLKNERPDVAIGAYSSGPSSGFVAFPPPPTPTLPTPQPQPEPRAAPPAQPSSVRATPVWPIRPVKAAPRAAIDWTQVGANQDDYDDGDYSDDDDGEPGAPDECLLCPISLCLMDDPVLTSDGHTFDRASISAWFANGKTTSPITNEELKSTELFPNALAKSLILQWQGREEAAQQRLRDEQRDKELREKLISIAAGRGFNLKTK